MYKLLTFSLVSKYKGNWDTMDIEIFIIFFLKYGYKRVICINICINVIYVIYNTKHWKSIVTKNNIDNNNNYNNNLKNKFSN